MSEQSLDTQMPFEILNPSLSIGALISAVTKLTGVYCTSAMIDNYEKKDLIHHSSRSQGGFRQFSYQDVQTVASIKLWQSQGFSLDQIKEKIDNNQLEFDLTCVMAVIPQDRRAKILKAAFKIFNEVGYEKTTLQDISVQSNVPISSIYKLFDNKEDIFMEIVENMTFRNILFELSNSLTIKKSITYSQIRQSLILVGVNFLKDHGSNAKLLGLMSNKVAELPNLRERYVQELIIPVEGYLKRFLDHAIKQGVLREIDTHLAVRMFFGIFADITHLRDAIQASALINLPNEKDVPRIVDLFLEGIKGS